MKKFLICVCSIIVLALGVIVNSEFVYAKSDVELKKLWFNEKQYPILPGNQEWREYDFSEIVDILNPPECLLSDFSTNELAKLVLKYPYLVNLIGGYEDPNMFFTFMDSKCLIYHELLNREDGVHELLTAFAENSIDIDAINSKPVIVYGGELGALADIFVCEYVKLYWNDMLENDKILYQHITNDKLLAYNSLINDESRKYLIGELLFCNEINEGENLDAFMEENHPGMITTSNDYFMANGQNDERTMCGVTVKTHLGNYYKHGTSAPSRQWYEGEFDSIKKAQLDANQASAYPRWSYVSSASAKYNCHSYAWISANCQNQYWLPTPTNYFSGNTYYYVGTYVTEKLDLHVNDRLVIYDAQGTPCHSMIITDPNYQGTMITESKNSYLGVYRVKFSDMMTYYVGASYRVYRHY